ncbi:MAG TPA: hypothetical protein VFW62_12330, partial [bacterium]|nr:hypothetical protein [bacterium]
MKTPKNAKGLGLIIGLAVALPICFLLACGVGGYLLFSSAYGKAKSAVAKASRPGKSGPQGKVDPNNPFAALDSPEVQKQMEQAMGKAFDQMDAELKKQQKKSPSKRLRTTRPSGANNDPNPSNPFADIPMPPPIPRDADKDDYPTNLKRLQTGNDDERRRAADWFSRAPLEADKQDEVAKALNGMHTDSLRKHALGALKVWGTAENVPMICRIMQQEAFVKIDCMTLLEKFKDERAIEPLITVLNEAFGEGDRAEELLADWWPQAEAPLVKQLHAKEGRLRERTLRILELRKTDQALLVAQSLA